MGKKSKKGVSKPKNKHHAAGQGGKKVQRTRSRSASVTSKENTSLDGSSPVNQQPVVKPATGPPPQDILMNLVMQAQAEAAAAGKDEVTSPAETADPTTKVVDTAPKEPEKQPEVVEKQEETVEKQTELEKPASSPQPAVSPEKTELAAVKKTEIASVPAVPEPAVKEAPSEEPVVAPMEEKRKEDAPKAVAASKEVAALPKDVTSTKEPSTASKAVAALPKEVAPKESTASKEVAALPKEVPPQEPTASKEASKEVAGRPKEVPAKEPTPTKKKSEEVLTPAPATDNPKAEPLPGLKGEEDKAEPATAEVPEDVPQKDGELDDVWSKNLREVVDEKAPVINVTPAKPTGAPALDTPDARDTEMKTFECGCIIL